MKSMEPRILNQQFQDIAVVDFYESFIWSERYNQCGDCELYLLAGITEEMWNALIPDNYIYLYGSDELMIIETKELINELETGRHIKIEARSLTSILDRRIIWGTKTISGNLQTCIRTLLNENIISPSISARRISNFVFEASTDSKITSKTIESTQLNGDNLLEVIITLCTANDVGFKVYYRETDNKFVFKLYVGADRSYDQLQNPYVAFKEKFENIISTNYLESTKTLKNVILVGGEGEGDNRTTVTVGTGTGLARREIYSDSGISSQNGDTTISSSEYSTLLRNHGTKILNENITTKSFDGEVEATQNYKYDEDFFMGDIVELEDVYGHDNKVRVTELVRSQDASGIKVLPGFTPVKEEGGNS